MRGSFRAFVAVVLLIAFPFLVIAIGVGGILLATTASGRAAAYLFVISIGVLITFGIALVSALRTRMDPPAGPRLSRQEQPALWACVDELSAQVQTRAPDEIILIPDVNAAVCEDSRMLGLRAGKRYMMIGLPLLAGMSVDELRAVLAHELGHYSGGHTRLLAITYRGTETLQRTVARLDGGPARFLLNNYAKLYMLVASSANRQQELEADQAMVRTSGQAVAIAALRKLPTLSHTWDAYSSRYLPLAGMAERTPDLLLGYRAFLLHPNQKEWVEQAEEQLLDTESSSLFDSHPPIRQRIAVIASQADRPAPGDIRPAWSLLHDPQRSVPAVEGSLLKEGLGPRAQWAEIVRLAGVRSAERGASMLAKAAADSQVAPRGMLGDILQALGRGQVEQLVKPVLKPTIPFEELPRASRSVATELLADVVVAALAAEGRIRHELNWGGGWVVRLLDDGSELDAEQLVAPAAHDPAKVRELWDALVQLRVPLGYVRWPSQEDPQITGEPQLTAVFGTQVTVGRNTWHDLLVYDTGLLLFRLPFGTVFKEQSGDRIGMGAGIRRKRLTPLVEASATENRKLPNARWIGAEQIAGGSNKSFLSGGGRVVLNLSDGSKLELRGTTDEAYEGLVGFVLQVLQARGGAVPAEQGAAPVG
ncbi:M48 family metallopeptidase [Allokutzneria sp. A3M-2-11 16]|uniref:M48 family metallopeptidase n=1 Tax=Allokutzneria sp. A3M-2-11 16 TaxID=2962043 RepID=UPI0020B8F878|nr:M48 family metallopeptidase [Allokutzneria sp. A3M-2-11 16]MCP3800058.1 M48 family metallopeptidase [Allokutzneria sp. A3M-2-11 16]